MSLLTSLIASFLLATLPSSIASKIVCEVPESFTVPVSYDAKATIFDIELILQSGNDDLSLRSTPDFDTVKTQSENLIIIFNGLMDIHYTSSNETVGPTKISELFYETLIGAADRSITTLQGSESAWCRVGISSEGAIRSRSHESIGKEIYLLAESCAQRAVCSKIRSTYSGLEARSTALNETTSESASLSQNSSQPECPSTEFQKTLNMMVDSGLAGVIGQFKKSGRSGQIDLPEVTKDFNVGSGIFKSSGKLHLSNGTFGDLATVRRRSDAVISHKGWKLTAACEVGLDRAEIEYKHYELQYGMKAEGAFTGIVHGVALAVQVSANFDEQPCVATMDHIKVTRFGEIQVDMTGLPRPLNLLLSTFAEWFTAIFRKNIVSTIEANIRHIVDSKLSSLNCEKFRPWN